MRYILAILILSLGCVQVVEKISNETNATTLAPTEILEPAKTPLQSAAATPTAISTPMVTPQPTPASTTAPTPAATPAPTPCTSNWQCTQWGECINDKQNRMCTDANSCSTDKSEQQDCISLSHIIFSEILYDTPGNDNLEEWIKLYNPANTTTGIANWSIADNAGEWKFSAVIAAGNNLKIARNSGGFRNLTGCDADVSGLTRGLNNDGDYLTLKDSGGNEIDFVAWEKGYNNSHTAWTIAAQNGKSIRRVSLTADTDSALDWVSGEAQPCL